jgi:hypothetical protein
MGKAKKGKRPELVRVGDVQPGQWIRFHDGVAARNLKVYEVVRFVPIPGTNQGHLELKDPQADRLEAAPDLLSAGFRVELVS